MKVVILYTALIFVAAVSTGMAFLLNWVAEMHFALIAIMVGCSMYLAGVITGKFRIIE